MQETNSMAEKLALWKANKKSKIFNNSQRSSQTHPLRLRTNHAKSTDSDTKKPLGKVASKPKAEHDKNKWEDENTTRLLPEAIIQSALNIVDALKTPPHPASTPNGNRIKPLPSPHLLIMEAGKGIHPDYVSSFTQTVNQDSEIESDWKTKYNELMELYQLHLKNGQKLSDQLISAQDKINESITTNKSKDEQISQLIESNEDLQEKLLLLKKAYDKLDNQANEWHRDLVNVESSLLEEYESKSNLREQIEQLSQEKMQLEQDLFDFNELLNDMKMVATESEKKDEEILKLEIKLEDYQEQILALEAHIFKKDQDALEFDQEFKNLQERYEICASNLESHCKETSNIQVQTSQIFMESIFTQTNLDETSRENALLRMNNSVLSQQLNQAQKTHQLKILEMQQQMETENQKWQEIEMSQAAMHRKLIDALEKTVSKNKELKKELEMVKR